MEEYTQIGNVAALTGEASAKSVDGVERTLSVDSPIFQDDTIITADSSTIELSFVDGTVFSQGADSVMLLDEYVYNQSAGTGELLFNLAKGSLRAVSGEIAKVNPEGFNVETPLSTVGIRGTTFFVLLDATGQVVGVEQMDPTHVVEVSTNIGTTVITTQGDLVAVQLDGFISDPTHFTPDFLDSVREQLPLQADPHHPGDTPDHPGDPGDSPDGQGGQDIPDDLQEDVTGALQQLQLAGGAGDDILGLVHDALGGGDGGLGSSIGSIDSIDDLQSLLTTLQTALSTITNAISNLADDILFDSTVQTVLASFDFSQITSADTDGSDYLTDLQNAGYNIEEGDNYVNTLNGETASKNAIFGYDSTDTITGGANTDAIFGGDGADKLNGGLSSDYIFGGLGGDDIQGQGGSDYLVGGDGADKFRYDSLNDGGDVIKDFAVGTDSIVLTDSASAFNFGSNIVFESVAGFSSGAVGENAFVTLVYDTSSGKLYYDTDSTDGISGATHIATFENGASLSASDISLV